MIYSWYWYDRNAVVASLPDSFEEMMENPFLRDLGCFARHLRPYLDRFPAKNILVVQFDAIRRDPDHVRRVVYEFLNVAADFKPQARKRERIQLGLLAFLSFSPSLSVSTLVSPRFQA